ncbi:hypothetical protein PENNAL_c0757G00316, partial [Penicillium nalgiovense]
NGDVQQSRAIESFAFAGAKQSEDGV